MYVFKHGDVVAVAIEELDAVGLAVADQDAALRVDADVMHQRELSRLEAGGPPGDFQLAFGGEAVDLAVAVAVGGEDGAVLGGGHAGRHVERRVQGGAVGRHRHHGPAAAAQLEQFLAVLGVLGDDVLLAVGDPDIVVGVDEDAVRFGEFVFAPGGDEFAGVGLKGDDGMFVAAEDKDTVARIYGQIGHRAERPAFGQCGPGVVQFVAEVAISYCHDRLSSHFAPRFRRSNADYSLRQWSSALSTGMKSSSFQA